MTIILLAGAALILVALAVGLRITAPRPSTPRIPPTAQDARWLEAEPTWNWPKKALALVVILGALGAAGGTDLASALVR